MITKRWKIALGSLAAATLLLTACAPTDDSGGGGGDASADSGPVTLAYWDFLDPSQDNPRANALRDNIAAFEEANPNINIDLSVVSLGDMISRLPQAAAAGQAPDVFKMFTPQVPQMAAARAYSPLPEAALEVDDWLRPADTLAGPDGAQVAVPYEYRTCACTTTRRSSMRSAPPHRPPMTRSSTSRPRRPQPATPGSAPASRTPTTPRSSPRSSTAS